MEPKQANPQELTAEEQAYLDELKLKKLTLQRAQLQAELEEQDKRAMAQNKLGSSGAQAVADTQADILGTVGSGLEVAGKTLDAPAGAVRAGITKALEELSGKELINAQELIDNGQAPDFSEVMKRADILVDDPYYARTALGFGADVLTDPLTYIPGINLLAAAKRGGKAVSMANTLSKPLQVVSKVASKPIQMAGKGIAGSGKALYKSAFDKADRALDTRFGKESISDILMNNKFKGNMQDAILEVQDLNKGYGQEIGRMREYAASQGKMGAPDFSGAEKVIAEYRGTTDPTYRALAEPMQESLEAYKSTFPIMYPTEAASTKRTLRKLVGGDSAFDAMKTTPERARKEFDKAIMRGMSAAEESAMAQTPLFDEYKSLMSKYGATTKFTEKELEKLARQEAVRTGAGPSAIDSFVGPLSILSGDTNMLKALAAKKARDVGRMTNVKTSVGLGMKGFGEAVENSSPYIAPAVNRALWIDMLKDEQERAK